MYSHQEAADQNKQRCSGSTIRREDMMNYRSYTTLTCDMGELLSSLKATLFLFHFYISYKCVHQMCHTNVSYKCVIQMCRTNVSYKCVIQMCPPNVYGSMGQGMSVVYGRHSYRWQCTHMKFWTRLGIRARWAGRWGRCGLWGVWCSYILLTGLVDII